MSDNNDWKVKYHNSLRQLDEMEADCNKLDDLLRKAILRLVSTAKGQDLALDTILTKIDQNTREKNNQELDTALEELVHFLMPKENPVKNYADQSAESDAGMVHEQLIGLIGRLQLDNSYHVRIQELKSSLQSLSTEQCLNQLAGIINKKINRPDDMNAIQTLLIKLLEDVARIHSYPEQLYMLQEQLQTEFVKREWNAYLDEISSEIQIIIHNINAEKIALENLIIDATRQLKEISSTLIEEQSIRSAGRKMTQKIQEVMSRQVTSIFKKVETESDIVSLKAGINENLSIIKHSLESFKEKDTDHFLASEKINKHLQLKVESMEAESVQLKQKLSENHQKLMFDTLTGVRSRLSYDESMDQEISRWERYQLPFCYAIFDIDHFKKINDHFGHNAGDKVLRMVAKKMMQYIRKTDSLFRIGGEEFVLLLPNVSVENAAEVVEKIRSSVAELEMNIKNNKVSISLSAGLTETEKDDTIHTIYERADRALYDAKKDGRDKLVIRSQIG